MQVIGITGTTGSGKTSILHTLERMGYEILDCDALYHGLLYTDENLGKSLEQAFGSVFLPDGKLNRKMLADIVFHSDVALAKLNQIVFPVVIDAVKSHIEQCTSEKGIVIDAVNLIESGLGDLCSRTIAVVADAESRLTRIMARVNLTEQEARARIEAQKPDEWYMDHCNLIIRNDMSKEVFEGVSEGICQSLGL